MIGVLVSVCVLVVGVEFRVRACSAICPACPSPWWYDWGIGIGVCAGCRC